MTSPGTDRGGVLVVQVWFEDGPGDAGLRARITSCVDLDDGRQETVAVTSTEAVVEVVRSRLAEMRGRRQPRRRPW